MTGWRNTLAVWLPLRSSAEPSPRFSFSGRIWSVSSWWTSSPRSASMAAGVIVIRLWKPGQIWRFDHEAEVTPAAVDVPPPPPTPQSSGSQVQLTLAPGRVARAWMPFALLTLTVLAWGVPAIKPWGTPAVKDWLDARLSWKPEVPWLHLKVAKGAAVTGHEELSPGDLEKAQVDIVPLSSTGTAVFLAAVAERVVAGSFASGSGPTACQHRSADGSRDPGDPLHACLAS